MNKISYWNFILARSFKVNIFLVLGILNSLLYGLYFGILHIIYSETIKVLYKLRKILKTVGDSSSLIWHFTMNFLKRNDKLLLIPSCWVRFIINQAYHSLIFRKFILLQKLESSENLIFIPLRGKINSMGSREEIKMPKKWSHGRLSQRISDDPLQFSPYLVKQ